MTRKSLATRSRSKCKQFRAVAVRVVFILHTIWAVYLCTVVTATPHWWLFAAATVTLLLEAVVTLKLHHGHEYMYFCPSIFFYCICIFPPIWVLQFQIESHFGFGYSYEHENHTASVSCAIESHFYHYVSPLPNDPSTPKAALTTAPLAALITSAASVATNSTVPIATASIASLATASEAALVSPTASVAALTMSSITPLTTSSAALATVSIASLATASEAAFVTSTASLATASVAALTMSSIAPLTSTAPLATVSIASLATASEATLVTSTASVAALATSSIAPLTTSSTAALATASTAPLATVSTTSQTTPEISLEMASIVSIATPQASLETDAEASVTTVSETTTSLTTASAASIVTPSEISLATVSASSKAPVPTVEPAMVTHLTTVPATTSNDSKSSSWSTTTTKTAAEEIRTASEGQNLEVTRSPVVRNVTANDAAAVRREKLQAASTTDPQTLNDEVNPLCESSTFDAVRELHKINSELQRNAKFYLQCTVQLLLLLLIIGRWALPKGTLTHNQLSQLLLVYFGDAADIAEFFDTLNDKVVAGDQITCIVVLACWSVSVIRFSIVIAEKEIRDRRSNRPSVAAYFSPIMKSTAKRKMPSCFDYITMEVVGIGSNILMQNAPYLGVRLYVIIEYQIVNYTNLFFAAKNMLTMLLMLYRLVAIFHRIADEKKAEIETFNEESQMPMVGLTEVDRAMIDGSATRYVLTIDSSTTANDTDGSGYNYRNGDEEMAAVVAIDSVEQSKPPCDVIVEIPHATQEICFAPYEEEGPSRMEPSTKACTAHSHSQRAKSRIRK